MQEPDAAKSFWETADHLNSAAIHLLRGMKGADRESGLTPARLSALSVLVFGGSRTLTALAATEDVAAPTMTRIVDGLVALGLAERGPHPDSARKILVSATDAGNRVMHRAAERRREVIVAALRSLDDDAAARIAAAGPDLRRLSAAVPEAWQDLAAPPAE